MTKANILFAPKVANSRFALQSFSASPHLPPLIGGRSVLSGQSTIKHKLYK